MWRRLSPRDHPGVALGLSSLAFTLESLGRAAEALPLLEESLAMRRRLFPGDHPDVAAGLNNLAMTLDSLGRAAEALPFHERAIAMKRRLFRATTRAWHRASTTSPPRSIRWAARLRRFRSSWRRSR